MTLLDGLAISSAEWAIMAALASAVVAMAVYFVHIHKIHREEQKENLINMISTISGSTKSNEGVARSIEGNTKILDEMKTLIHTVNDRLIKMDAENAKRV